MTKNFLIVLFIVLSSANQLLAQEQVVNNKSLSEYVTQILHNESNNSIKSISFSSESNIDENQFSDVKHLIFGDRTDDSWNLIRSEKDGLSQLHSRYQQIYKGIPVENYFYIFHYKNDFLYLANGDFYPNINISTVATFEAEKAIEKAISYVNKSNSEVESNNLGLVIYPFNNEPYFAYKIEIHAESHLINSIIYVDAHSGKVINESSQVCSFDVSGTAHTQFSGVKQITTKQNSTTNFTLEQYSSGNGIITNKAWTNNQVYADDDNVWNNVNSNLDQYAPDVHFGLESCYDFFMSRFNRNSYNNAGGLLRGQTNDWLVGANATWSGNGVMRFGNGDVNYYPFASLDIVAHEFSHGVTQTTANLIYDGESGALNESFSDIFGNTIRFLYAPEKGSWYLGDQIVKPLSNGIPYRNMSNPNEFQNPDTYHGLYYQTGDTVHVDSGVQNFWYYLLVEGGSGTNDNGDDYSVVGIGLEDALKIAYHNLAYYLTANSGFNEARNGSINAAIDLFGLCSQQYYSTIDAWHAVGVGSSSTEMFANSHFTSQNNFSCTPPLTTQFFATENNYNSYLWDFGDGTTSNLPNPTHTYSAVGNFDVTLTIGTTTPCVLSNTQTLLSEVVIGEYSPMANFDYEGYLIPGEALQFANSSDNSETWFWDFGDGTTSNLENPTHTYSSPGSYNVTLTITNCIGSDSFQSVVVVNEITRMCDVTQVNTSTGFIFDSGGENGNYGNNETCSLLINPCNGQKIELVINEFDLGDGFDRLRIYDGLTTSSTLIANLTSNTINQSSLTYTSSDHYLLLIMTTNHGLTYSGFNISYQTIGTPTTDASFYSSTVSPGVGGLVQFQDMSTYNPIAWHWDFGDGTSSNLQNPTHSYSQHGAFDVSLISYFCDDISDTANQIIQIANVVELDEIFGSDISFNLFPNPSTGEFTISSNTNIKDVIYEIVDVTGRIVQDGVLESLNSEGSKIHFDNVTNGYYFLKINSVIGNTPFLKTFEIQLIK